MTHLPLPPYVFTPSPPTLPNTPPPLTTLVFFSLTSCISAGALLPPVGPSAQHIRPRWERMQWMHRFYNDIFLGILFIFMPASFRRDTRDSARVGKASTQGRQCRAGFVRIVPSNTLEPGKAFVHILSSTILIH